MRKEDKSTLLQELVGTIQEYQHFYVVDTDGMNAGATSDLRRTCFKENVKMVVVKNTIFTKALEECELNNEDLKGILKGTSAVMFSNTGNSPARLIKEFSRTTKKPVLKGAYVEESVYVGADQLETLVNIKSKEELIGDVIGLLQSPVKNVLSALQSGGTTIHGTDRKSVV